MTWSEYMIMAARHSKGNAQHWFRYLRKYIDKCDVVFSRHDVDELYRNDSLTPFQRVSVKAAFEDGSPTRLYIHSLNSKPDRTKLTVLREKYEGEQDLIDIGTILKHDNNEKPFMLHSVLTDMGFKADISVILDTYEKAHGMDWLDAFYTGHQDELHNYL